MDNIAHTNTLKNTVGSMVVKSVNFKTREVNKKNNIREDKN